MRTILMCLLLMIVQLGQSQVIPTSPNSRMTSVLTKMDSFGNSPFLHYPVQCIGPSVFGGRVADLDVNPNNATEFYVAYASGGLWYTDNNGTSFTPLFDRNETMTIGDIAVNWNTGTIWVATGEVNSSRSSYSGTGIYVSYDKGRTWTHRGLEDSHHIGRIIQDPNDSLTLYVAVLGHLYSKNEERGVFKTTDGGLHWHKTLYINDSTGVVDMIIDPEVPSKLYAATWQRDRKAWNFNESGSGSGIYYSQDGAESWQLLTDSISNFPQGNGTGRIGLSLSKKNGKDYLFAVVDNYSRRPKDEIKIEDKKLKKEDFEKMTKEEFLNLEDSLLVNFLKDNGFPEKYDAAFLKEKVDQDEIVPRDMKTYLEDANSLLFDTDVIGAEVYLYDFDTQKWTRTHDGYLDGLYYSYGYYFGQIRSQLYNPNKLYIMGVPILKSEDMGKSWENINGDNVHVDHHALWIDQNREGHIILGNDGGINISYDDGENWTKCFGNQVGQFYYVAVDDNEPYNVYGGLQDNGVWKGKNNYSENSRWQMKGDYPYKMIMGGDGMQVQIDPRDNETVYTGFQFGNYYKITGSGDSKYITPSHELGDHPYRWNWQSPILISPHNPDIVYMGANKLLRSLDGAGSFSAISDDLTNGGKKGDVAYGTLTSISESPLEFGLIYTGSDDGKVFRSDGAGYRWVDLGTDLPLDLWVSVVLASRYDKDRVYVALNGYRWDNFEPMLYRSNDRGEHWEKITNGIGMEPINSIVEDPKDKNNLYVATDGGMYFSSDGGLNFYPFSEELPKVPIHHMVIQERKDELIIGTHGRSIWKAKLEGLRMAINNNMNLSMSFKEKIRYREHWDSKLNFSKKSNLPNVEISVFSPTTGEAVLSLENLNNKVLHSQNIKLLKGVGNYTLDLVIDEGAIKEFQKSYLNGNRAKKSENGNVIPTIGKYKVVLTYGKEKLNQDFEISKD
ncbi:MAG TPA: glycosyl hydrolase [Saprospiraceae bacterium]|nr:glycosyl hydrolase [Saprospiraceae bacterium]